MVVDPGNYSFYVWTPFSSMPAKMACNYTGSFPTGAQGPFKGQKKFAKNFHGFNGTAAFPLQPATRDTVLANPYAPLPNTFHSLSYGADLVFKRMGIWICDPASGIIQANKPVDICAFEFADSNYTRFSSDFPQFAKPGATVASTGRRLLAKGGATLSNAAVSTSVVSK